MIKANLKRKLSNIIKSKKVILTLSSKLPMKKKTQELLPMMVPNKFMTRSIQKH